LRVQGLGLRVERVQDLGFKTSLQSTSTGSPWETLFCLSAEARLGKLFSLFGKPRLGKKFSNHLRKEVDLVAEDPAF